MLDRVPAGNETILLVEDDEALRNLARDVLEASDCRCRRQLTRMKSTSSAGSL